MSLSEPAERFGGVDREAFDGRTVLVTGGLGFIGSALTMRLKQAGAEIHTVSRRGLESAGEGRHWPADLSDGDAVARLVREVGPHFVFHLAATSGGRLICITSSPLSRVICRQRLIS